MRRSFGPGSRPCHSNIHRAESIAPSGESQPGLAAFGSAKGLPMPNTIEMMFAAASCAKSQDGYSLKRTVLTPGALILPVADKSKSERPQRVYAARGYRAQRERP